MRHYQHIRVGQQRLHHTVNTLQQIQVGLPVRVAVLELVLIAPGKLLREAFLDLLVGEALANAGVDFVQIFDGSPRTGNVLHGANRSA